MTHRPATLTDMRTLLATLPVADDAAMQAAVARNGQLTKPPGALGRLEDLAIWLAGWQGTDRPRICSPRLGRCFWFVDVDDVGVHHPIALRKVWLARRLRRSWLTDDCSYRFGRTDVVATEPA